MALNVFCKFARKIVINKFTSCKYYNRSAILFQFSYDKLIFNMPPKRKQQVETAKEDDTKTTPTVNVKETTKTKKEKAVIEEDSSRPKRTRTVQNYYENTEGAKPKKAAATKAEKKEKPTKSETKETDDEPEVKTTKGRKKITEKGDDKEVEEKPTKGRKKAVEKIDVEIEKPQKKTSKKTDEEVEEKPTKGRKKTEKPVAAAAPKNKTSTAYESVDFDDCSRKNEKGETWNFKISNWNVDGIRAWLKKGGLEYINYEKPDIFCLQETKCSKDKLPNEVTEVDNYKVFWASSDKDGYAGVALYTKQEPISVQYGLGDEEFDNEGRMITAEYEKFYVISVYVPNSGRGLVTLPKRLKWNAEFRSFVAKLDKKKPVIIAGDMNVSHLEIDLANPKTNTKNAGFTKEERDGMTEFLSDGYVDTFRKIYPDKTQAYTFWSYMSNARAKNIGWRLDYFIVSERMMETVCDNIIRSEVFGSDHCPITLFLTA